MPRNANRFYHMVRFEEELQRAEEATDPGVAKFIASWRLCIGGSVSSLWTLSIASFPRCARGPPGHWTERARSLRRHLTSLRGSLAPLSSCCLAGTLACRRAGFQLSTRLSRRREAWHNGRLPKDPMVSATNMAPDLNMAAPRIGAGCNPQFLNPPGHLPLCSR